MISSTSTFLHCGLERHKNLEKLCNRELWAWDCNEKDNNWVPNRSGYRSKRSPLSLTIQYWYRRMSRCCSGYLLKAVRVLTAVFWAAALVLGEPCVDICFWWLGPQEQRYYMKFHINAVFLFVSITCDSSWQSVTRLRHTCSLKENDMN